MISLNDSKQKGVFVRKRLFLVIFAITFSLLGTNKEFQFTTHGLTFLIDEIEGNLIPADSISNDLRAIIWQEASPIVATFSIVEEVIGSTPTKEKAWIIKKISEKFCLLIPRSYLGIKELKNYQAKEIQPEEELTKVELKLGLKIDHLENLSFEKLKTQAFKRQKKLKEKIKKLIEETFSRSKELSKELLNEVIPKLFITRHEYYKKGKSKIIPKWGICFIGHGMPYADKKTAGKIINGGIVSGIHTENLPFVLDFLGEKTNTSFISLISCFDSLEIIKKAFDEINKKSFIKSYPFVIASGAGINSTLKRFIDPYNAPYNFKKFFNALLKDVPVNFGEVMGHIFSFYRESYPQLGRITSPANLPVIKLPRLDWTQVLDLSNKVVQIGRTLAYTRTQPLNVSKYFAGRIIKPGAEKIKKKIYPEVVLLYAEKIPFTLIFEKENEYTEFPAIVSMIPGNFVHEFSKIQATQFKISEVAESFLKAKKLQENKIFTVKEVEATNDFTMKPFPKIGAPIKINNLFALNEVRRYYTVPNRKIFFGYNGEFWKAPLRDKPIAKSITKDPLKHKEVEIATKELLKAQKLKNPEFVHGLEKIRKVMKKKQMESVEKIKVERGLKNLANGLLDLMSSTKISQRASS